MPTKIERFTIPEGKRVLAISDVHAHRALLEALLEKAGFCEADELFVVGDLIAKGPDSLGTLRLLMALSRRPNVHVLKGNMEMWHLGLLDSDTPEGHQAFWNQMREQIQYYGHALFQEMLDGIGFRLDGMEDVPAAKAAIRAAFEAEIAFMRALPDILETQRIIFVHGGIPTDDLDSLQAENCARFLKNDGYIDQGYRFDKTLILGHWPVSLYYKDKACHLPFVSRAQNMIGIDGGCGVKDVGQLNALILRGLDPLETETVFCDGFPVQTAGRDQEASETCIHIDFRDGEITILEEGPEFSLAEHNSTGYRLDVLNSSMWAREDNRAKCEFTDCMLRVKKGDRLSVVRRTSKGYLVKKDGCCGWYFGTLEDEAHTAP